MEKKKKGLGNLMVMAKFGATAEGGRFQMTLRRMVGPNEIDRGGVTGVQGTAQGD